MRCTLHGPQMRKMQKLQQQWLPQETTRKKKVALSSWIKNERNKTDDHALSLLL